MKKEAFCADTESKGRIPAYTQYVHGDPIPHPIGSIAEFFLRQNL